MSKIGWLNNRRYKLPEDTSFLLNDLDAKDEEIARLRAALREIAEHPTGGVGCNPEGFVKAARAALEGK